MAATRPAEGYPTHPSLTECAGCQTVGVELDTHGFCDTCRAVIHSANGHRADSDPSGLTLPAEAGREYGADRLAVTWASDVTPEPIEWLWADRLPLRDLAVLAGEPGLGKSTTTAQLAADVTRGTLDGALHHRPRRVLILSAEDHFESVIWGRLKAAGADLLMVGNVRPVDGRLLSVPGDVEALAAKCSELREQGRPAALIIIDPIAAYLGGTDSHKDAAVRAALAPLAELAHTEKVCVLVVAHLNKSAVGPLLNRLSGSGAFGAAPRSVLVFARDPDDPDGDQGDRRVLVHVKTNHGRYAPTLAAHIAAAMVEEISSTVSTIVVDGEVTVGPEDLQGTPGSTSESVRDAVIDALDAGKRKAGEVKGEVASKCGVSERTVERAAKKMADDGELERTDEGYPSQTYWTLASGPAPCSDTPCSDKRVATGRVGTAEPPPLQAIGPVGAPCSDTPANVSEQGQNGALIGYSNRCSCADGGDGDGEVCERCYGHRRDATRAAAALVLNKPYNQPRKDD